MTHREGTSARSGVRIYPNRRRLSVSFPSAEAFGREYRANIANGGTFVATEEQFELRDVVEVDLDLAFCDRSIALEAEIVHIVPPELARAGGTPGAAVQFLKPAPELREMLDPLAPAPETPPAPAEPDRRADSRTHARVFARLQAPDAELRARTRDLSQGGVLVSVEGPPIPVGETVRLALRHPSRGDELEVDARVVRHVETEAGVVALGVQFDTSENRHDEVSKFVEDLKTVEHARHLGGIRGAIEELGLPSLIQMFAACSRAGTLTVTRGAEEGVIVFEDGALLGARAGAATGKKALMRLLDWREGGFEFRGVADPVGDGDPAQPLDAVLLEAARQIDETARHREQAPPPGTRFLLDADALAAERGSLDKTAEAVIDLVAAGFTLRALLDVIPEPDGPIYAAVAALCDRGLISPVD